MPIILEWLEKNSPDVLCLQETKVQDKDFPADDFRKAGYNVVFRGEKSYNGVAIVSRDAPEYVAFGIDDAKQPDEARLIRGVFAGIPIVNTYVPQGTSPDSPRFQYKLEWFARLRALFERHYSPEKPLIWVGDLNVAPEPMDVYNPEGLLGGVCYHPDEHKAFKAVKDWGFVDVFRKHCPEAEQYSFWDYRVRNAVKNRKGWRLDHILATKPLADTSRRAYIDVEPRLAERPSDHTFVVAEFTKIQR